jgi:hypothetical protein
MLSIRSEIPNQSGPRRSAMEENLISLSILIKSQAQIIMQILIICQNSEEEGSALGTAVK